MFISRNSRWQNDLSAVEEEEEEEDDDAQCRLLLLLRMLCPLIIKEQSDTAHLSAATCRPPSAFCPPQPPSLFPYAPHHPLYLN